jgi:hypothetical protein
VVNYSKDWRKISAGVLKEEPYCRECATYGIKRRAKAVDHIIALSRGGTDDRNNLQALCWRHHSKKTVRDGKRDRLKWLPTIEGIEHDLLRTQLDMMWTRAPNGRIQHENDLGTRPAPLVAMGVTNEGERLVEIGSSIADADGERIRSVLEGAFGEPTDDEVTQIIACIGEEPARAEKGPIYTFLPSLPSTPLDGGARMVWCQDDDATSLIAALVGAREDARDEMMPIYPTWAAVVTDDRIVSMCRTVRQSPAGAEAGVNTHAKFRGRGFAAAATALWATKMRATGRSLFYSTGTNNLSSQRVAQRLQLRRIGTLWTLRASS